MHSRRLRRTRTAGLALATITASLLWSAAPASAAAALADPDDTTGPADIKAASIVFDASNATITVETYEAFADDAVVFGVFLDLDGDSVVDRFVTLGDDGVAFGAVVSTGTPRETGVASSHAGATATATVPIALLGGATSASLEVAAIDTTTFAVDEAPDAPTIAGRDTFRAAGLNRVETAVQSCFAPTGEAGSVVLARSDSFADALAGSPLAVDTFGCLLLTPSTGLDPATLAEMQRVLEPGGTVYLLGGTAALSPAVESAVAGAGFTPLRLAGTDRYETAIAVATQGLGSPSTVMLATGLNFPDALAAGAAAGPRGAAILLTQGSTMPASVATYLQQHPPTSTYAIGGPAAAAAPSAVPIVGTDRYDTAVKIATTFFSLVDVVGVASGVNFPDALAGGAAMGIADQPLLLTDPASLPAVVSSYLTNAQPFEAWVFGGSAAVSNAVVNQVDALVG
jgi:putative cell wall-binding protein